jgi:muramoyltetrapeptide carboxypeptidase
VGVVATGFAVDPSRTRAGMRRIAEMGFRVVEGAHLFERHWFARGGYGTARILERVPFRLLEQRPRVLVGYSDVTALFGAVLRRTGQSCLYGPVVAELGERGSHHAASLRELLAGREVTMPFRARQVRVAGRARGTLVGGNLTVLAHLWGTRYRPSLHGAVLLFEDIGEETYRLDRLLTQLRLSGALAGLSGVLVGHMAIPPTRRRHPPDRPWEELLLETFSPLGIPVVVDLPVGHRPGKWTVPLGGLAEIDTRARTLRLSP